MQQHCEISNTEDNKKIMRDCKEKKNIHIQVIYTAISKDKNVPPNLDKGNCSAVMLISGCGNLVFNSFHLSKSTPLNEHAFASQPISIGPSLLSIGQSGIDSLQ